VVIQKLAPPKVFITAASEHLRVIENITQEQSASSGARPIHPLSIIPSSLLLDILSYFEAPSQFLHVMILNKSIYFRFHNESLNEFWCILAEKFGLNDALNCQCETARRRIEKFSKSQSKKFTTQEIANRVKIQEQMHCNPRHLFIHCYRSVYRNEIENLASKITAVLDESLATSGKSSKLYYSDEEVNTACELLRGYDTSMNEYVVKFLCRSTANICISTKVSWGPNSFLKLEHINLFYSWILAGAVPLVKLFMRLSPHDTIKKVLSLPCVVNSGTERYTQYNWCNEDERPRPNDFQAYSTIDGKSNLIECSTIKEFIKALLDLPTVDEIDKEKIVECLIAIEEFERKDRERKGINPIPQEISKKVETQFVMKQ
jgi:hypothetical protein